MICHRPRENGRMGGMNMMKGRKEDAKGIVMLIEG
jgi:hypothetical protein